MARLGPDRSADLVLRSLDYGAVRQARHDGRWRNLARLVVRAGRGLRRAGAEGLWLCSNSLHGVAPQVEAEVGLPLLHIADATAAEAHRRGLRTVSLFGTGFTMRQAFLRRRLEDAGLDVRIPDAIERVDAILLEEVARGHFAAASARWLEDQLNRAGEEGADAVVLGCTEIPLLIDPQRLRVPTLDTLALHTSAAVDWLVADEAP